VEVHVEVEALSACGMKQAAEQTMSYLQVRPGNTDQSHFPRETYAHCQSWTARLQYRFIAAIRSGRDYYDRNSAPIRPVYTP
jgi:hypothetical protein